MPVREVNRAEEAESENRLIWDSDTEMRPSRPTPLVAAATSGIHT